MTRHSLRNAGIVVVTTAALLAASTAGAGQTPSPRVAAAASASRGTWTPERTPDGQPDIQGTWVNFDPTPFEAPAPVPTPPPGGAAPAGIGPPGHWAEHDSPQSGRRKSMVVEPADGRVPLLPSAEARRDYDLAHLGDSYVHETPWVRCVTRGHPAGMFPAGYNNAYEIIQIPGYVVIAYEMIHETRIIPVDGRPHVGTGIRQWNGDSRGRWEGQTLVVETTNYNDKGSIATSAATGRIRGIPQSEALHVVERFTRTSADNIAYEVTITDPKVYARPWKVALPLNRDPTYQMFEYACHEGNLSIPNELLAGRAADREAAQGVK